MRCFTAAAVVLASLVGSPGCSLRSELPQEVRCSDGQCPPGLVCREGTCGEPDPPDPPDAAVVVDLDAAPIETTVDAAVPDAGPIENLVDNPDFEPGVSPWNSYNGVLYHNSNEPHAGQWGLKSCKVDVGADDVLTAWTDLPRADPSQGSTYQASIWIRASFDPMDLTPPGVYLSLREWGGASPYRDSVGPTYMPLTTEWAQLTAEITVEEADREMIILIVWTATDVPDGTCFIVDDAFVGAL